MIVILDEKDLKSLKTEKEINNIELFVNNFGITSQIVNKANLVGFFDKSKNKIQIIKNRYTDEVGYTSKKKFLKIPKGK